MDFGVCMAEMPCLIYFHPKYTVNSMINSYPWPHRWPSWPLTTVVREPGHPNLPLK